MTGFEFKIIEDKVKLKSLEKNCKTLNKRHIRFGWYEGKSYSASHPNRGLKIAQVAHWQEYGRAGVGGNKSIPSRPYFRQTINSIKRSNTKNIRNTLLTAIYGNDVMAGLNKMSLSFVKEYHSNVMKQNHKRLADYTIQKKGHSYQMVDSGVMATGFKSRVYRQNQANIKG